jgi:hypothetical protein
MPPPELTVIAIFPSVEEAHMARNLLLDHEISSHLIEARGYGDHVHKPDVHLLVPPECAATARQLLPKKSRLIEPSALPKSAEDSAAVAFPEPQAEFEHIPGPSLGTMLLGLVIVVGLVAAWFVYFFIL